MWQDKNAEGRGQFEQLQKAYQVLTQEAQHAAAHSTEAETRLELLMRTQAILYERCSAQLGVYRYPSYASLCALIQKQMLAGKYVMSKSPAIQQLLLLLVVLFSPPPCCLAALFAAHACCMALVCGSCRCLRRVT